jgi:hypothetical protein
LTEGESTDKANRPPMQSFQESNIFTELPTMTSPSFAFPPAFYRFKSRGRIREDWMLIRGCNGHRSVFFELLEPGFQSIPALHLINLSTLS